MPSSCLESGTERCAWCNGTGHSRGHRCEVCGGRGLVNVAQPAMKCTGCWGTGRASSGWIESFPLCPDCGGTGWARMPIRQKAAGA